MSQMPWFRVYSEILDDRKLKRICKKTGHSKALVIGVWTCLLALANNATPRGELSISEDIPYTIDDLEDELGLPSEIIHQLIDEFKAMGMMNGKNTLEITNWEKRQFKSDNSTERVRRFREKEAEEVKRYDETLQKRAREEQNRTDTDKEEDTEQNAAAAAFGKLCKVYEAEIGALTPAISDELDALISEYEYTWIMDAIKETRLNNVRNLKYTVAILKNWKAKGYKGGKKKKELSAMSAEERTKYYELPDYLAQP